MNYPARSHFDKKYDPESLLTGAEIAAGLTYKDARVYPDAETERKAYAGELTPDEIVVLAPRVHVRIQTTFAPPGVGVAA